jgi:hypothetical protein
MDEMDINQLIQIQPSDMLRSVALEVEEGKPVAATVGQMYRPIYAKAEKKTITAEQQARLKEAWNKRVETKRELNDNEDNSQVTRLKKAYFSSIEDYKRLHKQVYGE